MKISDLRETDFQKYFEVRLANNKLRHGSGSGHTALCPFHPDRTQSFSVNTAKGVWFCHSGCGNGGLIDFEQKLDPSCDKQTAIARIAEIVGSPQLKIGGMQPEAVYSYTDEMGKELFQVVRNPGKQFIQRRRDEKGGWVYRTADIAMVLYHLDEVLVAREVFITEGEKDCDNLRNAIKALGVQGVACTTSPRGAGKWQDTYAAYLKGRKVVILPDQDEAGIKHGKRIANSVYGIAVGVKVIHLPDVKDVSDFLKAGHTVEEVVRIVKETPVWHPEKQTGILTDYPVFEASEPEAVNWLVEDLIELGSNVMIVAPPKSGKSFVVLYLAMCLASGKRFFDFRISERWRVSYFSREDNPKSTVGRARRIRIGMGLYAEELEGLLSLNTRVESASLSLETEDDIVKIIANLKDNKIQVAIFDVMRVLHVAKENDNTEMQVILEKLNRIRDQAGVTVILVHHARKGSEGSTITEMARGAGAIGGWAECLIHVREIDSDTHTRKFEAELKSVETPKPFQWKINDYPPDEPGGYAYSKLEIVPFAQQVDERKVGKNGNKYHGNDD